MLRRVHTSQNPKRFLHQQVQHELKSNNITRPPTSHPYSALRNMRSQQTIHNKYGFLNNSHHEYENRETKQPEFTNQTRFKETVPKVFLHVLTQIRILFRLRDKDEQKIAEGLLANISRKISDLYAQNEQNKKEVLESEQVVIKLKDSVEQLQKKIKKLQGQGNSRPVKQAKCNETNMLLENIKLSQLNSAYLSKISELEAAKKQQTVQIRREVHQNQNTQILRFHNRISYLEMKLKNSEEKENQLSKQLQRLNKKQIELQEKLKGGVEQKRNLQQKLAQWRERANMQYQDSQMHLTRQNFLLFSIKKLRQLNKSLTEKLINQGNSQGNLYKHEVQHNPYFQYEVDFFKSIRSVFFDSKYKQFKLNSRKNQSLQLTNFELEEQYLQYRRYEQINLSHFTYLMPSFYSFIEESITNDIAHTRQKSNGSVSRVFIQILRAIFNSKLNEFLMSPDDKYTKFPQFVYTWFQKFYFNSEKNDIAALQPYMQKPFPQDLFYRDLMNIKLDQSWEIITFRQFLLEELTLEELYFYLMCQNLLFRRGSISKQKQYLGDFCVLVEYNAAKSVLDMVLSDFQSWNLSYLTSKMRQKIIYKKNSEYIQTGFFLRCLVQYYKIERINRYKYIAKLCDQFKSEEKGLRYSSFVSVINRFTEVSIQQKIQLYRQCYCLGRGKITADIIFTVCSQKLIFLKYLKLKCFFKLPLLTTQRSIRSMQLSLNKKVNHNALQDKKSIICIQPSDPYLYNIYTKMLGLLRADSNFSKQLEKLGMIEMLNGVTQLQKTFNEKLSNTDSSILRCRHFMHYLTEATNKIRVINFNNFYELLQQQNKKKNNEYFWIDIFEPQLCTILSQDFNATFSIYEKMTKYIAWKNKVYDFRLNHAARKIQRMVRKKFIAPFIQLYKIIYSQFKNGQIPPKE